MFNAACPTPALLLCSLLATLGLFRVTLLFTFLRLLEHGEIAFHTLAFCNTPPKTRLDAWDFAAKSKMVRLFVTLGPPRGCATARGGRRGGGGRPRGVQGSAPATVTEGAGPATGRGGAPKTRLGRLNLRLSQKWRAGS